MPNNQINRNMNPVRTVRELYFKRKKEICFSPKLTREIQLRAEMRERRKELEEDELQAKKEYDQLIWDRMKVLDWRHEMIRHALVNIGRKKNSKLSMKVDSFISDAYSNDKLFQVIERWLVDRDTEKLLFLANEILDSETRQ